MPGTEKIAYGLLGEHLAHSWSPAIHRKLGSWPYVLVERDEQGAREFILEGGWHGLNVTIPHKALAASCADVVSDRVVRTGVANCLVRGSDGMTFAENTDVLGFSRLLERFCAEHLGCPASEALRGAKAVVLGSGGASAAICASLEDAGATPVVISRSGPETYETIVERHFDVALLVNATPVGMYPNCPASPLDRDALARLGKLRGVIDVIYNPLKTKLLIDAADLGLPVANGLGMLVSQARFASQLFQGKELDERLDDETESELASGMRNIILIGMPGAGKTTTGKRLARQLRRPFIDLDAAVELECGRPPARIIEKDGEQAFRAIETRMLARYGRESGLVISCGGGIVTRAENLPLARQNGIIVLLERDIEALSTQGRPLSQNGGLERLASERGPLYEAWADLRIACTGTPEGDAARISSELGLDA